MTSTEGTSLTATGEGNGTVRAGTYTADPVAQLSYGTGYFDVSIAPGSSFDRITFEVCGLKPGQSMEWWNATVEAWQAVSAQTPPKGDPLCATVTVTLTASTSLSLTQLEGAIFGAVGSSTCRGVAADGGVFSFGDSRFHAPVVGMSLQSPLVGITAGR